MLRPEVLLSTHFAPRDLAEYHSPPWVHEVGMEDAVEALRAFAANPLPRRMTPLSTRYSWRGRIESQVLPYLPAHRAGRLRRSARWRLHVENGAYILAPPGVRGLGCNESVIAVWQLCDGKNRFADIVCELRSALTGVPDSFVDDVSSIVAMLLEHGAIELLEQ